MHVELTVKITDYKTVTILYNGVIRVKQYDNTVELHLNENYNVKCIDKFWFEHNVSTSPYIHIYNGGVVKQLFISEV